MHISFYKRPLFLILLIYSLCLALFLKIPLAPKGDISYYADGERHNIEGIVKSFSQPRGEGQSFVVKTQKADGIAVHGLIYADCENCKVLRGQKISFEGTLRNPEPDDNFGSFDWSKYLARRKIFCQSSIKELYEAETYSSFWVIISKVRANILDVFNDNFGPRLAPVLAGITIGEKGNIDKGLNAAFQDSGAMHLLVASGSNVGFVTIVVYFLCALFGLGRLSSAALALFLAFFYTLIAGADPPLVRAYIMTLSSTAGFIIGRKSGVLQGLVIAALAILVFNPQSIFDVGFQMSFLAALSIILLAANFKLNPHFPKSVKFILETFFVSFAAQAALMPVFTNYFYKVSLSAVFSNIILVPMSGFIMAGGFIVWLLSFARIALIFKAAVFLLKMLLIFFTSVVEYCSGFYISKIATGAFSAWSVAAYYVVLFAVMNYPIIKKKFIFCVSCAALACGLIICGFIADKDGIYILRGRYNYSVVSKGKGKIIVIGGGTDAKTLSRAVLASGRSKIDCLFLNSLSPSAAYGLKDLDNIKVKQIYIPYGVPSDDTVSLISARGIKPVMLWPLQKVCGVSSADPWYGGDGQFYTGEADGKLSYSYKGIETSGNMQTLKTSDGILNFKKN